MTSIADPPLPTAQCRHVGLWGSDLLVAFQYVLSEVGDIHLAQLARSLLVLLASTSANTTVGSL